MAISRSQPTLGEYLVREGIISQSQFNGAIGEQRKSLHSIGRILVEMGLITEMMRISILQKTFGYELANLQNVKIDPKLLTLIPMTFAEKHRAVPIRRESNDILVVGMEDPTDLLVVDAIKNQVGLDVEPVIASLDDIHAVLAQYSQLGPLAGQVLVGRRSFHDSLAYKILKHGAFPVLALAPLALFFIAILYDLWGVGAFIKQYFEEHPNPVFDMFLYFCLSWGLWSIILFEINGLIFGEPPAKEKEETE
jgi:hypothetical protein